MGLLVGKLMATGKSRISGLKPAINMQTDICMVTRKDAGMN